MSVLTSSNPVLSDSALGRLIDESGGAVRTNTATIPGVMQKTGICTVLAVAAGAAAYALVPSLPWLPMVALIGSMVLSLIIGFALYFKPALAPIGAPLYSIVQGVFLGCMSFVLEGILASRGITATGGLALQAFIITGSVMVSMLMLHTFGIIRAGPRFTTVLTVVTAGLAVAMLASFVVSFFMPVPFMSLDAAFDGGKNAWIGLAINVGILFIASLWLLVDFAQIDEAVAAGAPKSMEWLLAFGLIVTLAWVYFEALKLAFRLAAMFGERK
ncbi:MAG: Bax inhibitor-1/YccA family protein [Planctomycetota bacterium]|jgi:uncharacterized YccA/Bax inhibitor family protein|nr:Bax inhibitor-1/YccA family protein [Planctomycetota bacterium]